MIPTKPYLLRAIHQWAVDNDMTPQLLVDAEQPDVRVPQAHVSEGRIVLNVAPSAVRFTDFGNDRLVFSARFRGRPFEVEVPMSAVLAIFARENGQGLFFQREEGESAEDAGASPALPGGIEGVSADAADRPEPPATAADRSDKGAAGTRRKTGTRRNKPALRLVKS
jgi:stringent starvation protein B